MTVLYGTLMLLFKVL